MLPLSLSLLTLFTLLSAPSCQPQRPHVVFVTIDTLRADHLSVYGYPRPTSPFLEELAEFGVVFEAAVSTSPITVPSHASMFTSAYPFQHGAFHNAYSFPDLEGSLPTRMEDLGYETAAFVAASHLDAFASAFQHFDGTDDVRSAEEVAIAVRKWIRSRSTTKPAFVWLHFFDAHEWGDPDVMAPEPGAVRRVTAALDSASVEAFTERAHGAKADWAEDHWFVEQIRAVGASAKRIDPEQAALDQYDARIRTIDDVLYDLSEDFDALRGSHEPLWIVTADHGEGLGSHGYADHAEEIFQEQLRVPMIIAGPSVPESRRIRASVSTIDLMPTILELIGARANGVGEGHSLVPLFRGGELPERSLLAQLPPGEEGEVLEDDVFAIFDGASKLIARASGDDSLYELSNDPLELRDLSDVTDDAERLPERFAALQRTEARLRERMEAPPARNPIDLDEDEERMQRLEALGYL